MTEYAYREGHRGRVGANVVGAEIDRVAVETGGLTAEAVFAAATPEDAPLHPEFEWDGDRAVRQLGLIRARQLIRAVVVVEASDSPPRRAWVHIPSTTVDQQGRYERMEVVARRIDLFGAAIGELQQKLRSAEAAVQELRALASMSADNDRIVLVERVSQGFGAVHEAVSTLMYQARQDGA